jgi:hypothetical protein
MDTAAIRCVPLRKHAKGSSHRACVLKEGSQTQKIVKASWKVVIKLGPEHDVWQLMPCYDIGCTEKVKVTRRTKQ